MVFPNPQAVLAAIRDGELSAAAACKYLRDMETAQVTVARPEAALQQRQRIEEILAELDQLIGLADVKKLVREIYAFAEIQKQRQKVKLATEPLVLHMIFRGNPGTGKTTVARIIGKIMQEIGILQRGHIIEVERADLVGEYIGHTAQKTREQLRKAHGGILFIDEAYSLARGGEKDFGKEAIDCLVKGIEDRRGEVVLILAGYRQEMDRFLETNPGLRSRFPIHIDFADYSQQELLAIADLMCQRRQYRLSAQARLQIARLSFAGHPGYAGNARTVRNVIEQAIRRQAVRLLERPLLTREDLMLIEPEDIAEVPSCGK
ncbi:MAG: AAA family ATPase [Sporomusaceae bacterium]|nr:AAA family ATPase [Sporomusaceae bacterium]